jgi:hypothetical protein
MKTSIIGLIAVFFVIAQVEVSGQPLPFPGSYCPQIPDNSQPPLGSWGCSVDNYCNPVSMVNITEYWDAVIGHPNALGVNAGLPPLEVADYIGYYMATNGFITSQCGSPLRMNPIFPGTWPIDTEIGGFEYVRWDATNPFPPMPPPGLPPGKLGYGWTPFTDFVSGFSYFQGQIDSCLPPIVIFHYWNPIATGIQLVDSLSGDSMDLYLQGPPITNSGANNPDNPEEVWPCALDPDSCPDPELIGHAVTGVGYAANYDPDGPGPMPFTNWIVCHDNWSTTPANVMIEWTAWHATISFNPNYPSGISDEVHHTPEDFLHVHIFPNPFNSYTTIEYGLPEAGHARIYIYDLLGRKIEMLVDEEKQAGQYRVIWDASNHSSGVYFYRIEAGDFTETRKMILLK